jgi:hypothetical protein
MIVEIPKCAWCNKSDKIEIEKIFFEWRKKLHYVMLWMCKRCNANNGVYIYG